MTNASENGASSKNQWLYFGLLTQEIMDSTKDRQTNKTGFIQG